MNAIEHIAKHPEQVIFELEKLMKQTGDFYEDIFDTKSEHPLWLKQLEISGDGHIEDLEMHTKDAEKYKNNLSSRFNKIKEMVEDHRDNPKQQSMSKFYHPFRDLGGV
ncbi:hypothetical protein BASA83_003266 [Batrachochytrium salamandrivorans]|nr:hypothetical protein BASA83_003266 [Batrachochytrium salamandrivorans]